MILTLNLTQHAATPEQLAAGVVDLPDDRREWLSGALTFDSLPTSADLRARAEAVAAFAVREGLISGVFDAEEGFGRVMIGGAPFFMVHLELELEACGLQPLYAFSKRVSVEEVLPDGSVGKTTKFRHEGFVGT